MEIIKDTPAMKQYWSFKEKCKDCILLFRMGDFYECFYDDAKIVSKILDITLTKRNYKNNYQIPLAGIPYHSLDKYLYKLVKAGKKIAICEQIEDPKLAKGVVKRDITRIITPGVIDNPELIDESSNNFIASIFIYERIYIAILDITTADFFVQNFETKEQIKENIDKYDIKEIILPESLKIDDELIKILKSKEIQTTFIPDGMFIDQNKLKSSKEDELINRIIDNSNLTIYEKRVCKGLLNYINTLNKNLIKNIRNIKKETDEFLKINSSTIRNLELLQNTYNNSTESSLYWVLNKTRTAMGKRLLKKWIIKPLLNIKKINQRLDAVNFFYNNIEELQKTQEILENIKDIERLTIKIVNKHITPQNILILNNSLKQVKKLKLINFNGILKHYIDSINIDSLNKLIELTSIIDEESTTLEKGKIFKEGIYKELDELYKIKTQASEIIKNIEAKERSRTNIKNLRIGYNKTFGYFFEISKSFIDKVPKDYVRRQTLVNYERYINAELKEIESKILNADEKIKTIEREKFNELLDNLILENPSLHNISEIIAKIDILSGFGEVAIKNDYVKPILNDDNKLNIIESRHPVIELTQDSFIPNDCIMNPSDLWIITGPNMAGKSTYMRQIALIIIMAHIGSFVPAKHAEICLTTKIFSRIGATDILFNKQSTFMVEMLETSEIIKNADSKSFIILDEIGRGTSTFDGLSIAMSIAKFIAKNIKAKTMFATHYHQLNVLSNEFENIKNKNISVLEQNNEIIFLHKIIDGGTDKSYGIYVAKLAGMPDEIITEAEKILKKIEHETKIEFKNKNTSNENKSEINEQNLDKDVLVKSKINKIKNLKTNNSKLNDKLKGLNKWIK